MAGKAAVFCAVGDVTASTRGLEVLLGNCGDEPGLSPEDAKMQATVS
jgi:hypothetical protein